MGKQEENHVLSHWVCWLTPHFISLRVLTCGRKLLGLWPATQESPSARWSAPNFHQPDSVILQVRAQPVTPTLRPLQRWLQGSPGGLGWGGRRACGAGAWGDVAEAGAEREGCLCGVRVLSPGGHLISRSPRRDLRPLPSTAQLLRAPCDELY